MAVPKSKPQTAADKAGPARRPLRDARDPRRATLLPGLVTCERSSMPIPIRVTNMSASGASMIVVSTDRTPASVVAELPDKISLFLTYDRFSVACQVMWRRGDKLGVKFVSVPRLLEKPPTRARVAPKKK